MHDECLPVQEVPGYGAATRGAPGLCCHLRCRMHGYSDDDAEFRPLGVPLLAATLRRRIRFAIPAPDHTISRSHGISRTMPWSFSSTTFQPALQWRSWS